MKRISRTTTVGILAVVALVALVAVLAMGINRKVANAPAAPPSTTDPAQPTAVPEPVPKKVVLIGDYTAGSELGGAGPRNWTALVGLALQTNRPTRVIRDNSAGSGYVSVGAYDQTYLESAKMLVSKDVDAVAIFGSRYDMYAPPDAVRNAAAETYAAVEEAAPEAALVVIGPTWPGDAPPPQLLVTRDMVRDAASEAGAVFVDPIEEGWFVEDPGKLMAPDNVHLSDSGHERIALGIFVPVLEALTSQT